MKRVLFVDDHPAVLAGVCHTLRSRRTEWEPVLALDAGDAREQLAAREFHAVVCDIHMPGDDGEALLREIATKYPHIARIALTGDSHSDKARRVAGLCYTLLEKPCPTELLHKTLNKVLDGNAATMMAPAPLKAG
jgi:DNA-binding NarL/FixJ family response regulator